MCVCAVNWVLGWIIPRSCCVLLKDCQSAGKSSGPTWQRFGVQSRFFGTTISQLGPKTAMSWWGSLKWREVPGSWMLFQRTYGGFTHILSPKCSVLLNFGSAPHPLWILNCVFLLGPRTRSEKMKIIMDLPWIWHPALHILFNFQYTMSPAAEVCDRLGVVHLYILYYDKISVYTMEVCHHDKGQTLSPPFENWHVVYLLGDSACQAGTIFDLCQASICGETFNLWCFVNVHFKNKTKVTELNLREWNFDEHFQQHWKPQVQDLEEPVQLLRLEKANQRRVW